jgi:hypothetical protein
VLVGEALRGHRLDDQRRGGAALGPGDAGLVDVVVEPGGRAVPCVLVDRVDFPVGGSEHGAPVEDQAGELPKGQLEDERQVLIRTFLPACGPHQLEPFS